VVLNHFNFLERDARKFTGLTGPRSALEQGAYSVQIISTTNVTIP